MINPSQKHDPRSWERWRTSGAVVNINGFKVGLQEKITEAKMWLGYARNTCDDRTDCVNYVRECVGEAKISLEDIGTSEEELQQLLIDGYIAEAKKWLGYARDRSSENDFDVNCVREYLAKAGATFGDIGTSEAELQQLLIDGYIAEARKWLGYARRRSDKNDYDVIRVREYLAKAGATFGDIGTSEEELQQLLIDGYIAEAKKWLGYARDRSSENDFDVNCVREYLAKAGATFGDIGTSEEELNNLLISIA